MRFAIVAVMISIFAAVALARPAPGYADVSGSVLPVLSPNSDEWERYIQFEKRDDIEARVHFKRGPGL